MNPPPIFIIGAPRSGTSLLRRMLNRHPNLALCSETHFLRLMLQDRRVKAFGDLSNKKNRERLINEYIAVPQTRQLGIDCARLAARLLDEGTSYPAFFACVLQFYAESQGKPRCGEKTPRHALAAETLCEWFPGAAILHILRDPRDAAASLRRMPFGSSSAVLNARTWLRHNLAARRISRRAEYLQVRYETLVTQPEQELTRICAFIGEAYSPAMLTPDQASPAHSREWDRFKTPLTTSRVGAWRRELTPKQAAQVEWLVGPHLETFGYVREVPAASFTTKLAGVSFAAFARALRLIALIPAFHYRLFAPREIAKYERKIKAASELVSGIRR